MASIHIKHPGLLHKKLGIPLGEKIPMKAKLKAKHSSSPAMRKEATFAVNFGHKRMNRGGRSR